MSESGPIILQAPIEVCVNVGIIGDNAAGEVEIRVTRGRYPTEQEIRDAVTKFVEGKQMPEGFRVMTKREWFDTVIPQVGEEQEDGTIEYTSVAMPGGDDWDA